MRILSLISLLGLLGTSCSNIHNQSPHWDYQGRESPEHWAELSEEFVQCAEGHSQSPIDIEAYKVDKYEDIALKFNYMSSHYDAINNGHTVLTKLEEENAIWLGQKKFELKQFHYHAPSEHHLNGIIYPMELHFVHMDSTGQLAVIGLFVQEGPPNEMLEDFCDHLPSGYEGHYHPSSCLDLDHFLPDHPSIYHYKGSLTTPPCSEGVEWLILKDPISLSKKQIGQFTNIYNQNNRPIQPLYKRMVETIGN